MTGASVNQSLLLISKSGRHIGQSVVPKLIRTVSNKLTKTSITVVLGCFSKSFFKMLICIQGSTVSIARLPGAGTDRGWATKG